MNYGKAIKITRNIRGVSQKQLAEKVALAPSYISRMESGERKPTTETLETISKALNVPMYLMVLMSSDESEVKGVPAEMISKLSESLLGTVLESEKRAA